MTACATLATEGEPEATATARPAAAKDLCFADTGARPKEPSFCHGPGGAYIVGLPPNHDWKPGMRVYLRNTDQLLGSRPVGLAYIAAALPQAVEIRVLFQAPNSNLVGTTAAIPGSDQNLPGGHLLAHMKKRDGSQITLDVGSADGVKPGDTYEARDPKQRDLPIARAVVRTVHADRATAKVIDEIRPVTQDEWVFGGREAPPRPRAIKVLVVPPPGAATPTIARIRTAITAIKKLGVTPQIHIVESKPIPAGAPAKLHDLLLQKARDRGADQIVWMPAQCPDGACQQALIAAVPKAAKGQLHPDPLLLPAKAGAPAADARVIFGQLAYAAGIFDEASYHLRTWVGSARATATQDALTRLAQTELALGQRDRARMWLKEAASRKGSDTEIPRHLSTYLAMADVACKNADPNELAELEASFEQQSKATPELRAAHLAALLCSVETRMQTGGDLKPTHRLIETGLTLAEALGDRPKQMNLKRYMARSLAAQGRFSKADQLFAAALKLATAAKDRQMQARIGLDRATVRELSGNPLQAERHAHAALKLFKTLKDEQGIADTVPVVARLERHLHGLQVARAFLEAERAGLRGQHLDRALFAVGQESAHLDLEKGDLDEALSELTSLGATAHKQKHLADEAGLQGLFAEYYRVSGQPRRARELLDAYAHHIGGIDRTGPAQARAQLLYARFSLQEGDIGSARTMAGRALRSYASLRDSAGAAEAQLLRAEVEREFGDRVLADSHYEQARRMFAKVQATEGVYKVALGKATQTLWHGKASKARPLFPPIVRYFQSTGHTMMALEASLLSAWADFEVARDSEKALASLRTIKQRAMKQKYARLEAETQLLIACVYRRDSDHVVAEQELAVGQKLYAAIGRHAQPWPCDADVIEVDDASPAPR